jgi:hypothetical protein
MSSALLRKDIISLPVNASINLRKRNGLETYQEDDGWRDVMRHPIVRQSTLVVRMFRDIVPRISLRCPFHEQSKARLSVAETMLCVRSRRSGFSACRDEQYIEELVANIAPFEALASRLNKVSKFIGQQAYV